jgi:hypothetical protein
MAQTYLAQKYLFMPKVVSNFLLFTKYDLKVLDLYLCMAILRKFVNLAI